MALETATYLPQLVTSNPGHTDGLTQADSHLRLIKSVLLSTFPSFTAAALNSTQAQLDAVANTGQIAAQNGSSGAPSITFKNDATAGLYKGARTGQTAIAGTLRGAGSFPVGGMVDFPIAPATLGTEWLECDGTTKLISSFPDLAAFLGTSFGGDGVTTFGLPNLTNSGRFRRSRSSGSTAGTSQANTIANHNHTGAVDSGGAHAHTATVNDPTHAHIMGAQVYKVGGGTGIQGTGGTTATPDFTGTTSSATGISVSISTDPGHSHGFTTNFTGSAETRPEAFVVVTCIKT